VKIATDCNALASLRHSPIHPSALVNTTLDVRSKADKVVKATIVIGSLVLHLVVVLLNSTHRKYKDAATEYYDVNMQR
jgi:hypothetical protein